MASITKTRHVLSLAERQLNLLCIIDHEDSRGGGGGGYKFYSFLYPNKFSKKYKSVGQPLRAYFSWSRRRTTCRTDPNPPDPRRFMEFVLIWMLKRSETREIGRSVWDRRELSGNLFHHLRWTLTWNPREIRPFSVSPRLSAVSTRWILGLEEATSTDLRYWDIRCIVTVMFGLQSCLFLWLKLKQVYLFTAL